MVRDELYFIHLFYLCYILFFRQLMVMDESYVINQLKEDVSYVSTQFNIDMQIARLVSSGTSWICCMSSTQEISPVIIAINIWTPNSKPGTIAQLVVQLSTDPGVASWHDLNIVDWAVKLQLKQTQPNSMAPGKRWYFSYFSMKTEILILIRSIPTTYVFMEK